MSRQLLMIRHGQTTYNATGRMQGHLDTELSAEGIAQADFVGELLQDRGITKIISSDLMRAVDTASRVATRLGLTFTTDARLRETDLGQWQGKSSAEVDEEFPGARAIWRHDPGFAPPGGESRIEVGKRARAVVDELMRNWDDGAVLLVTHGGLISSLACNLLSFDLEQYRILSGLQNTHWAQFTARPAFDEDNPAAPATFTPDNVDNVSWYLDGWNMGARVRGGAGADV
ncbi:MAG: histidine phosphatase family protein [Corynebacterium sp.]|nr:histidine phosphatase family protein [Corynebacterium sp.]